MIHDNYNRLTDTEKRFIDDRVRSIMREFTGDTFFPYKLLGDDRAEIFVEAFATFLTDSAKEQGLVRDAIGIRQCEELQRKTRALEDGELIWGLSVR